MLTLFEHYDAAGALRRVEAGARIARKHGAWYSKATMARLISLNSDQPYRRSCWRSRRDPRNFICRRSIGRRLRMSGRPPRRNAITRLALQPAALLDSLPSPSSSSIRQPHRRGERRRRATAGTGRIVPEWRGRWRIFIAGDSPLFGLVDEAPGAGSIAVAERNLAFGPRLLADMGAGRRAHRRAARFRLSLVINVAASSERSLPGDEPRRLALGQGDGGDAGA